MISHFCHHHQHLSPRQSSSKLHLEEEREEVALHRLKVGNIIIIIIIMTRASIIITATIKIIVTISPNKDKHLSVDDYTKRS